jgi:ribose transport system permease protein
VTITKNLDLPVVIAFGFIFVLILGGSLFFPQFLSPRYLLQQLQIASFLGVVASGAMFVILLGHIDLSIPWTLTAAAIVSTALASLSGEGPLAPIAVPAGLAIGAFIGLLNGLGVAFLRVPSMIWTLGMNATVLGISVFYTGGFNPQGTATPLMRFFSVGKSLLGIPNALYVWLLVGLIAVLILRRMALGRYIYAIGNRETATYLSGVNTRAVLIFCFVWAGSCSALAGMMLAGYANQAYQAMGDPYLLPTIAAVVLGGTHILGGRGKYLGTVAGVILLTLLQSMLSIMQMEEAGRQIIYGAVIIVMLLFYGRGARVQD